jgi:hypothetical protein
VNGGVLNPAVMKLNATMVSSVSSVTGMELPAHSKSTYLGW